MPHSEDNHPQQTSQSYIDDHKVPGSIGTPREYRYRSPGTTGHRCGRTQVSTYTGSWIWISVMYPQLLQISIIWHQIPDTGAVRLTLLHHTGTGRYSHTPSSWSSTRRTRPYDSVLVFFRMRAAPEKEDNHTSKNLLHN